MSLVFRCVENSIELALDKMKADGLVSAEATFKFDAPAVDQSQFTRLRRLLGSISIPSDWSFPSSRIDG